MQNDTDNLNIFIQDLKKEILNHRIKASNEEIFLFLGKLINTVLCCENEKMVLELISLLNIFYLTIITTETDEDNSVLIEAILLLEKQLLSWKADEHNPLSMLLQHKHPPGYYDLIANNDFQINFDFFGRDR